MKRIPSAQKNYKSLRRGDIALLRVAIALLLCSCCCCCPKVFSCSSETHKTAAADICIVCQRNNALGFRLSECFPFPPLFSSSLSLCVFRWGICVVKQLKVAAIWQARLKCAVNTRLWQTELTKPSGAAGCCGCCQAKAAEAAAAAEAVGIPNGNNRKANIYCGWQQKGLRERRMWQWQWQWQWGQHLRFRLRWQRASKLKANSNLF